MNVEKFLENLSPDSVKAKLIDFVKKAHQGQLRKNSGDSYYYHLVRVAEAVNKQVIKDIGDKSLFIDHIDYIASLEYYFAALSHDIFECTQVKAGDIKSFLFTLDFSLVDINNILHVIGLLTKDLSYDPVSYLRLIKENKIAKTVKTADIFDNLRDLDGGNLHEKYLLSLYILRT